MEIPVTVTVFPEPAFRSLKVALVEVSVSRSPSTRLSLRVTDAKVVPSYVLLAAVAVTVRVRNWPLIAADIISDTQFGLGDTLAVNQLNLIASASVCDRGCIRRSGGGMSCGGRMRSRGLRSTTWWNGFGRGLFLGRMRII
jgi:hypothetical protein